MVTRDAKYIKNLKEKLVSKRSNWDNRLQEVAEFVFPTAADINKSFAKGIEKRDRLQLVDSTAIHAADLLSKAIHSSVTPPGLAWAQYEVRQQDLKKNRRVSNWIGKLESIVQQMFNDSNFDNEAALFWKYLSIFGTAGFAHEMEYNNDKKIWEFIFTALSPGEFYFTENWSGYVDTVIHCFEMTVRQIEERWGSEVLSKSEKLKRKLQTSPDDYVEILRFVSPKQDGEETDNNNHKFVNKYIYPNDELLLNPDSDKGTETQPIFVARFERIRGEMMGNSPALNAIPEIKSLNEARKMRLEAGDKSLNPPLQVMDGSILNEDKNIEGGARGITYVLDANAIQPLHDGARYDVAQMEYQDMQEVVYKMFFADQIQIQQEGKTPPSATQVSASLQMKNRILGPMFGRHRAEFLDPMMHRAKTFVINNDIEGLKESMPPELKE